MDERLRRSLLYVPASAETMLRKAPSRGADVIIVDLEDGVLPDAKEGHARRPRGCGSSWTSARPRCSCA